MSVTKSKGYVDTSMRMIGWMKDIIKEPRYTNERLEYLLGVKEKLSEIQKKVDNLISAEIKKVSH